MTSMRPFLVFGILFLVVGCSGGSGNGDARTGTDGAAADTVDGTAVDTSVDRTTSETTPADGKAVDTGTDGTNEQSMVDLCESISTDYASAITKAKECTLGAAQQCTVSVAASFFCQCKELVNGGVDTLAAISARFDNAGCQHMCGGTCQLEFAASCRADPTSSTGARCLPALPDGGP